MYEMVVRSYWLWPVLVLLLAVLWLWTQLQLRQATSGVRSRVPGARPRSVEAEDALKIAYGLQQSGSAWDGEELVDCMGLPKAMAKDVAGALINFGWAEEDHQGGVHLTEAGETRARELIRAHRLWEHYLVKREGMPLEAVHALSLIHISEPTRLKTRSRMPSSA